MNRCAWFCFGALALLLATTAAWAAEVPAEAKSHYEAGMGAKKSGDLARAAKELRAATTLAPKWGDARWALAWTYAIGRDKQKAIDEFNRFVALASDPKRIAQAKAALRRLAGQEKSRAGALRAPEAPGDRAPIHGDLAAPLKEANRQGKLLLVDFYGAWCPWCARMSGTLRAPNVRALLAEKFHSFTLDVGRFQWHSDCRRQYGVTRIPHIIVFNPDGSVRLSAGGYRAPDELLGLLRAAAEGSRPTHDRLTAGASDGSQRADAIHMMRPRRGPG
ncbi:MAG: thioredoxin family protein [Armatimonadota bacterium]|jgi:tetratricopeptide (TPR) repeat protein